MINEHEVAEIVRMVSELSLDILRSGRLPTWHSLALSSQGVFYLGLERLPPDCYKDKPSQPGYTHRLVFSDHQFSPGEDKFWWDFTPNK